jgi:hypothetical protein
MMTRSEELAALLWWPAFKPRQEERAAMIKELDELGRRGDAFAIKVLKDVARVEAKRQQFSR